MARTTRCKNSTAHGWIVRDGGRWAYPECCPAGVLSRRSRHDCTCTHQLRTQKVVYYNPHRKDRKADRRVYYKTYRAKVKEAMFNEDWEAIPRFVKSCGWLTW